MNVSWTAIVGIFLALWRWLTPKNKWESKREAARKKLKEIYNESNDVTVLLAHAKETGEKMYYRGQWLDSVDLDTIREQLLTNLRDCQRDYDYFAGLCDKNR